MFTNLTRITAPVMLTLGAATLGAQTAIAAPADPYRLTGERAIASGGSVVAILGLVVAIVAIRTAKAGAPRPRRRGRGAFAVGAGAVGCILGAYVLVTADAGLGSGQGVAGGVVAVVVGLASILLGGRALSPSH